MVGERQPLNASNDAFRVNFPVSACSGLLQITQFCKIVCRQIPELLRRNYPNRLLEL